MAKSAAISKGASGQRQYLKVFSVTSWKLVRCQGLEAAGFCCLQNTWCSAFLRS